MAFSLVVVADVVFFQFENCEIVAEKEDFEGKEEIDLDAEDDEIKKLLVHHLFGANSEVHSKIIENARRIYFKNHQLAEVGAYAPRYILYQSLKIPYC